jgi:hypothetical protein
MSLNFQSCKVSVCPRVCNEVADSLATYGVSVVPLGQGERAFWCNAPSFVSGPVSSDMAGSFYWLIQGRFIFFLKKTQSHGDRTNTTQS